jgi:hypothetical protein
MLSNLNYQLIRIYESLVKTSPASSGTYCTCLLHDLTLINLLFFFTGQKGITMPCICAHVCVCVLCVMAYLLLRLSGHMTDSLDMWYGRYPVGGHFQIPNLKSPTVSNNNMAGL